MLKQAMVTQVMSSLFLGTFVIVDNTTLELIIEKVEEEDDIYGKYNKHHKMQ